MVKNHLNSLPFAKKRIGNIAGEINRACEKFPSYGPNDFKFLLDIADLVYAARRAVAYSYVERYYLRGAQRQAFYDFLVSDLERSLEWLNEKNEEDWLDYAEKDHEGNAFLGKKFFAYKAHINGLKETCAKFFCDTMQSISEGLPTVQEEVPDDNEDYEFEGDPNGPWKCPNCLSECPANTDKCIKYNAGIYFECKTMRPKLTAKMVGLTKNKVKKEEI